MLKNVKHHLRQLVWHDICIIILRMETQRKKNNKKQKKIESYV